MLTKKIHLVLLLTIALLPATLMAQARRSTPSTTKPPRTQTQIKIDLRTAYPIFDKKMRIDSLVEYYNGAPIENRLGDEMGKEYNGYVILDQRYIAEFYNYTYTGIELKGISGHQAAFDEKTKKYSLQLMEGGMEVQVNNDKQLRIKELIIDKWEDNKLELTLVPTSVLYNYAPQVERAKFSYKMYLHMETDEETTSIVEAVNKTGLAERILTIRYGKNISFNTTDGFYDYDELDGTLKPRVVDVYDGESEDPEYVTLDIKREAYFLDAQNLLYKYDKPLYQYREKEDGKWIAASKEEVGTWQLVIEEEKLRPVLILQLEYKNGKKDDIVLEQFRVGRAIPIICTKCEVANWKIGMLTVEQVQEWRKEEDINEVVDYLEDYDAGGWIDEQLKLQNYEIIGKQVPITATSPDAKKPIQYQIEPITKEKEKISISFYDQKGGIWTAGKKKLPFSYERQKKGTNVTFTFKKKQSVASMESVYSANLMVGNEFIDGTVYPYGYEMEDADGMSTIGTLLFLGITDPQTDKVEYYLLAESAKAEAFRKFFKIKMDK